MTERKLDIFEVLRNIDQKNISFYNDLNEDQKKAFVPFVTMQWLACSQDDFQTIAINEFVNKYAFSLHKHPDLLYKLMTCCVSGQNQFYKWKKTAKVTDAYPESIKLLKHHLQCSTKRAREIIHLVPNDELLMLACDYGYQKDEYKKLQKELKQRP